MTISSSPREQWPPAKQEMSYLQMKSHTHEINEHKSEIRAAFRESVIQATPIYSRLAQIRIRRPDNNDFDAHTEMQLQSVLKMFTKTIILLCAFSVHCSGQNIDYDDTTSSGFCECPIECTCTTEEIDCSAKSLIKVPIQFEKCDWLEIEVL